MLGYQAHLRFCRRIHRKWSKVQSGHVSGAISLVWLQLWSMFAQTSALIDPRNSSPVCNNMLTPCGYLHRLLVIYRCGSEAQELQFIHMCSRTKCSFRVKVKPPEVNRRPAFDSTHTHTHKPVAEQVRCTRAFCLNLYFLIEQNDRRNICDVFTEEFSTGKSREQPEEEGRNHGDRVAEG